MALKNEAYTHIRVSIGLVEHLTRKSRRNVNNAFLGSSISCKRLPVDLVELSVKNRGGRNYFLTPRQFGRFLLENRQSMLESRKYNNTAQKSYQGNPTTGFQPCHETNSEGKEYNSFYSGLLVP